MRNNHEHSSFLKQIPNLKYMPRWGVFLLDMTLCFIAFGISLIIGTSVFRYSFYSNVMEVWWQMVFLMTVQAVCFVAFHTYSGIIRYSTFTDIINVLKAVLTATILLLVVNNICQLLWGTKPFFNTVLVVYLPISFILLFALRVGVKTLYDSVLHTMGNTKRVFIYGTQSAGLAISKMLKSSGAESPYMPVGFLIDDHDEKIYSLQGLNVYPINSDLVHIMQEKDVHDIIVSPIKMKQIRPAEDLEIFLKNNIHILTAPAFNEWDKVDDNNWDNLSKIGQIESIRVEDLLERPTIQINTDNVSSILTNQVVLITGAAGSIGSEIVRQVLAFHPKLAVLVEQAESPLHDLRMDLNHLYPDERFIPIIGDVRNREQMEQLFSEYRPDVVFHAAAYKHVPLMEEFPNEAVRANVLGTKNVADMSVAYGTQRFVMISTDKAVNPTNVMGASKRIAEMYVQSLYKQLLQDGKATTKFITTRFGNVLGSNGSVIPYFKKQIASGGPVTVTHPDIIRYFMTIPEACTLVLEAATLGNGGEIFVFDMGQPVKIYDLAQNMIRLAGYRPGIDIMITFTGLRPGEKLFEELLNQRETTLPTNNEKIMIAKVREVAFSEVSREVDTLISMSEHDKAMKTVKQMKKIVPEFKSKNSIYEQLDK